MLKGMFLFRYVLMFMWMTQNGKFREFIWETEDPYYRRFGNKYKKKRQRVKNLWIATGIAALFAPIVPWVFSLCLLATFLSFSLLDESE